jgi:hypothetical protein
LASPLLSVERVFVAGPLWWQYGIRDHIADTNLQVWSLGVYPEQMHAESLGFPQQAKWHGQDMRDFVWRGSER